jgi:hypothetical protein
VPQHTRQQDRARHALDEQHHLGQDQQRQRVGDHPRQLPNVSVSFTRERRGRCARTCANQPTDRIRWPGAARARLTLISMS